MKLLVKYSLFSPRFINLPVTRSTSRVSELLVCSWHLEFGSSDFIHVQSRAPFHVPMWRHELGYSGMLLWFKLLRQTNLRLFLFTTKPSFKVFYFDFKLSIHKPLQLFTEFTPKSLLKPTERFGDPNAAPQAQKTSNRRGYRQWDLERRQAVSWRKQRLLCVVIEVEQRFSSHGVIGCVNGVPHKVSTLLCPKLCSLW